MPRQTQPYDRILQPGQQASMKGGADAPPNYVAAATAVAVVIIGQQASMKGGADAPPNDDPQRRHRPRDPRFNEGRGRCPAKPAQ